MRAARILVILNPMNKTLCIKGRTIGKGKPLLCVPVVEDTRDGILSEFRSLLTSPADMIEWRADLFEEAENIASMVEVAKRLSELSGEKLLLGTYRTAGQGGGGKLPPESVEQLLTELANAHAADLLDLEYFSLPEPEKTIRALRAQNVAVVASHHDFAETPETDAMAGLLSAMYHGGADIVKLAVMPQDMEDVLRLLSVTHRFQTEYPGTPIITMSMGRYGMLSRLCGEFFGIAVTFGSHTRASAPGQIDMNVLSTLLTKIHESYEKEDEA